MTKEDRKKNHIKQAIKILLSRISQASWLDGNKNEATSESLPVSKFEELIDSHGSLLFECEVIPIKIGWEDVRQLSVESKMSTLGDILSGLEAVPTFWEKAA